VSTMTTDSIPIQAPPPATTKALKDLKNACQQFEAVFAKQLLSEMRKGTQDQTMGDQAGSAIYQDMMDQAVGDAVAKQGALGIGQMLYREFAAQVSASGPHSGSSSAKGKPADSTSPAASIAQVSKTMTAAPHFETPILTRAGRTRSDIP